MTKIEEVLQPLWNLRKVLHVEGRSDVMVSQSEVGEMLERLLLQVERDWRQVFHPQ